MHSYNLGFEAESKATSYIRNKGYSIIDRNWRTKWCEIDIVAKKNNCLHFVEVKYRSKTKWGNAIDYVTPNKLRQMKFASKMWVNRYKWQGEYKLLAIAIDGSKVQEFSIDI